jgi:hypothetical protein
MGHHFRVGDQVRLAFGFHDQDAVGTYAVTRLLPTSADGDPQYRVRGMDDRERVIGEAQIERSGKPSSPSRPRSPRNPITEMFNRSLKPE